MSSNGEEEINGYLNQMAHDEGFQMDLKDSQVKGM
jgi:hypothetical protein